MEAPFSVAVEPTGQPLHCVAEEASPEPSEGLAAILYRDPFRLADGVLKEGENELEIRYTTTLANGEKSLTRNEAAQQWAKPQQPDLWDSAMMSGC